MPNYTKTNDNIDFIKDCAENFTADLSKWSKVHAKDAGESEINMINKLINAVNEAINTKDDTCSADNKEYTGLDINSLLINHVYRCYFIFHSVERVALFRYCADGLFHSVGASPTLHIHPSNCYKIVEFKYNMPCINLKESMQLSQMKECKHRYPSVFEGEMLYRSDILYKCTLDDTTDCFSNKREFIGMAIGNRFVDVKEFVPGIDLESVSIDVSRLSKIEPCKSRMATNREIAAWLSGGNREVGVWDNHIHDYHVSNSLPYLEKEGDSVNPLIRIRIIGGNWMIASTFAIGIYE